MPLRPAALALALALPAFPAAAEEQPSPHPVSEGGTVSFTFENDIFGGTDRNYTNGVRLDYISPRNDLPLWGRLAKRGLHHIVDAPDWYVSYAIGQNIYTPPDISIENPPPGERPYAGFLHGSFGVIADSGDQLDTFAIDLGVVGPASLAEQSQTFVHGLIGDQKPQGWDTQVDNEPAFRLLWERKYRFLYDFEPGLFGLQVDAAPQFNVSLGNVDTSAAVGATVRIGDRLEDNYGPPRVRPAVSGPGFFEPSPGFGWYLFASAEARVVGYNMFLQGNLFKDGVDGVDPKRLVGDFQAGIAVQFQGVELTYTHVLRSPEYDGQDGFSQFGSLNLRFKL